MTLYPMVSLVGVSLTLLFSVSTFYFKFKAKRGNFLCYWQNQELRSLSRYAFVYCSVWFFRLVYIRERTYYTAGQEDGQNFLARLAAKFSKQWGSLDASSAGRSSTMNQFKLSLWSYRFQLLLCMRGIHFLSCLSWNFPVSYSLRTFTSFVCS